VRHPFFRRLLAAAAILVISLTAAFSVAPASADDPIPSPAGVTLTGLDAHDGTIYQDGGTLYLVGTRYGCGYRWQDSTSPFCGFGLWTSSALAGPWAYQGLLFDPNGTNSVRNEQWRITCNYGGNGCFNPRLMRRHDGVWLLYFNAPAETMRGQSAGYYLMGCNSPAAGACGSAAAGAHGSTYRMPMQACQMGGDFAVVADGDTAYLACSNGVVSIERLDVWWANGAATTSSGAVRSIAYLTNVEAPGLWRDASSGMWVMTYSDPMCGYCGGTGTGYIVAQSSQTDASPASTPLGVWLPPTNVGWAAPVSGRRNISASSCGGQPRTVFSIGGQPYQWIDLWYGQANETLAGIRLEPLVRTGQAWRAPADGGVWRGALRTFECE
jgi:hypothetical protein